MAGYWSTAAWRAIVAVHNSLPVDADLAERRAALRQAYPFGMRKYWPYKVWLRCQRTYLARYQDPRDQPPLTPDNAPLFFHDQPVLVKRDFVDRDAQGS